MTSKIHTLLFASLCLMAIGSNIHAAPWPPVDCRLVLCALETCDNPIPADPSVGRCCPICPDIEPPTCPPEKPLVFCIINPCQVAKCPAHPDAICIPDYCGGCNARFYDRAGNEVTDSCECPVEGQKFTECGSPCPANCTNPSPICIKPCVARCECPPGTVINEVTNKCVPVNQCPTLTAEPPTCPPDKPLVNCLVDPCQVTRCPAHPSAKCVADYCGGCNARFYDQQGNEVTDSCNCPVQGQLFTECGSSCPPNCTVPNPFCTDDCVARCECPSGTVINEAINKCVPVNQCPLKVALAVAAGPTCPPGKPVVQCAINPCQFASCPAHPDAECVADYCGGCNARFYDQQGNEVTDTCEALSVAQAQIECPIPGQVFTTCGSTCPPTCTIPNPDCIRQCVPACQCPIGTVLNEMTNMCVPPKACPSF